MIDPRSIKTDRHTQDFDSLIELPRSVEEEITAQLALIAPTAYGPRSPFAGSELEYADQHTIDHNNCPACIAADEALQGLRVGLAKMLFRDASTYWMRLRKQSTSLKGRTHETTQDYLDTLEKFFGALRLCDITPGHIRGYQLARLADMVRSGGKELHPWKHKAGHSIINHEISALGQIMSHCRLWQRVRPFYFPLSIPGWSPRSILTEEEEERLWKTAAEHPEAALAYWVATITNNTTAAGIELRGLRLKHLFLHTEGIAEIYVPEDSVKNNSRPRKIALNPTARWAVEQCYKRALRLGSCQPEHYLFPFRVKPNTWDVTRPGSRWFLRKSWDKLRAVTGFTDLNPHDLRHHCITRLLENDVEPETVRAIAGHVTPKMMEYYAHQRTRVKYAAVMAIEPRQRPVAVPNRRVGGLAAARAR
jgi:integrase